MNIYIAGYGIGREAELPPLLADPQFRRATPNMAYAYLAASEALKYLSAAVPRHEIGLVIGTGLGEIRATADFLTGLAEEGVARPLAFQNSLHHSTLGFLSRALNLTGPGFTVSREFFSGEDAILAGQDLLAEGAPYALVIGVDVALSGLERLTGKSGAAALLLTNEATDLTAIENLEWLPPGSVRARREDHYDADAVAEIARAVESPTPVTTLSLDKPDGSRTLIRLRRGTSA